MKITIVGRPNVGKSSVFNRLIGKRRSLVHDFAGVTRDRVIEPFEWEFGEGQNLKGEVIDTGGLGGGIFDTEIQVQVAYALRNADLVLLVVDGRDGMLPLDEEIARLLLRENVQGTAPVWVIVNKIDDPNQEGALNEFYSLGFENIYAFSAEHKRGVELLKEEIYAWSKAREEAGSAVDRPLLSVNHLDHLPHIAVVGKPNVGKSTLVNALLGERRMVVSDIAGTTVDAVDSYVKLNGHEMVLVDTAGIRRKSKTEQGVEVLSVVQTKKALARADVALLVIDGELGPTDQDEKIGGLIEESGAGVIIIFNKWDLMKNKEGFTREDATDLVRRKMGYLNYAPILFTSALNRTGLRHLGDLIQDIVAQRSQDLPTKELTELARSELEVHNPQNAKIYYVHQTGRRPPSFVFHVNNPEKIHFSVERHLANVIRARWEYIGTPIRLKFVSRSGS